jgi:hypothetical protein
VNIVTKMIDYNLGGTLTGANFGRFLAFIPRKLSRIFWTAGERREKDRRVDKDLGH